MKKVQRTLYTFIPNYRKIRTVHKIQFLQDFPAYKLFLKNRIIRNIRQPCIPALSVCHIHFKVGKNFFANYNCTLLDVAKIKIGDNCQMAPNVAIYTAVHPVHPVSRNSAYEYGKEVTVGDNVWFGGNTVVCPSVHIGSNVVIGAGSVVTKDIPDWCIAAGNPCRVIRNITEKDRRKLFRDEEIDGQAW